MVLSSSGIFVIAKKKKKIGLLCQKFLVAQKTLCYYLVEYGPITQKPGEFCHQTAEKAGPSSSSSIGFSDSKGSFLEGKNINTHQMLHNR